MARAASQKIAVNNQTEYNAHINLQIIQGTLLVLSAGGDPRNLAVGVPLTIYSYENSERAKQDKRTEEIESRITDPDYQTTRDSTGKVLLDDTIKAGRDAAIGSYFELGYNPALLNSAMNNGAIISAYPSVINASMRSADPTAALRLNSSLYWLQPEDHLILNWAKVY